MGSHPQLTDRRRRLGEVRDLAWRSHSCYPGGAILLGPGLQPRQCSYDPCHFCYWKVLPMLSANGVISYKVCHNLLLITNFTTSYLREKMCVHPIITCSELFCPSGMFS